MDNKDFPEFIYQDDMFIEEEIKPIERNVLAFKNGICAFLFLRINDNELAIYRIDPREVTGYKQNYQTVDNALDYWIKSLDTTKRNGWIIHPLDVRNYG